MFLVYYSACINELAVDAGLLHIQCTANLSYEVVKMYKFCLQGTNKAIKQLTLAQASLLSFSSCFAALLESLFGWC